MTEEHIIDSFVRRWALKFGVELFTEGDTFEAWSKRKLPRGQREAYYEHLLNQIQTASCFHDLPDVEELAALNRAATGKVTVMSIVQTWVVLGMGRSGVHFQEMPGDTEETYWKRLAEQVARYLEEEEMVERLMKLERRKND